MIARNIYGTLQDQTLYIGWVVEVEFRLVILIVLISIAVTENLISLSQKGMRINLTGGFFYYFIQYALFAVFKTRTWLTKPIKIKDYKENTNWN